MVMELEGMGKEKREEAGGGSVWQMHLAYTVFP